MGELYILGWALIAAGYGVGTTPPAGGWFVYLGCASVLFGMIRMDLREKGDRS